MNRGDVYDARLDPTEGSEQAGSRPVIIVSRDAINTNLNIVGSLIANNVDMGGGSNLSVTHTGNVPNSDAPRGGPYTLIAWQDF